LRRRRCAAQLGDALLEAAAQPLGHVDVLRREAGRIHGLELPQPQRRVVVDVLRHAQEPCRRDLVEPRQPAVHREDPAARWHERVLLHLAQPSTSASGRGSRSRSSASTSTGR
jgi:hypothetical protein